MKQGRFDKVFLLLIPLGVALLIVICNICLDGYYQIKLNKDTREILDYIVTKDCQTSEECKAIAVEQFAAKKYEDNEALTSTIVGNDYLLIVRYNYINDLRVFLNIFHINIFDKNGMVDDQKIDSTLSKKSGMVSSKYIVKLNEYKEPVVEKFKGDENEFILENETTTTTTTQPITDAVEVNE